MWQVLPQPVKDCEAVGVDVAPVHDVDIGQPAERLEHRDCVPAAKDHHRRRRGREREVGDLVLDHVGTGDAVRCCRELTRADRHLGESTETSGHPETGVARLTKEAVARGEVGRGGLHAGWVELGVE
jgi:hypothetical protein